MAQDTPSAGGKQGMVTGTTGARAIEAGVDILRQGGTAADAVAATAMTQVCMAAGSWVSYAGIYTMVYFNASDQKAYNLNAAYNTVAGESDPRSIPGVKMSDVGQKGFSAFDYPPSGRTALVPGFMAGIEATHRRFGKLSLAKVFEPAIRCALEGFEWSPGHAGQFAFRQKVLTRLPETKAVFLSPEGSPPKVGELFRQPALARTLQRAARDGIREYLYLGDWARKLVAAVQADGGKLTLEDLAGYEAMWTEPAHGTYHGYDIYSHGLPAAGGVNLIEALNLAEVGKLSDLGVYSDSPLALYWLAQISKPAFILGPAAMVANDEVKGKLQQLGIDLSLPSRLKKETSTKIWQAIEAGKFPEAGPPVSAPPVHSDSVVAIDQWGNIAAVVHSINTVSWGACGIFVDGISIPDSASFQQEAIAATGPGKRLPDPATPGLVVRNGKPFMGFGSIGSGLNIRTVSSLINVMDFGMSPQQAIEKPSLGCFVFGGVNKLTVGTKEFTPEFLQALRDLGQDVGEDDPLRGYWLGIQLDPATGRLSGGSIRELNLGGRAVGY